MAAVAAGLLRVMKTQIRPFHQNDIHDLVELTLLAFEPIFASFEGILGPAIFPILYPDWRKRQAEGIEKISRNEKIKLWVAELNGYVIGLLPMSCMRTIPAKSNCLPSIPNIKTTGLAPN